MLAIRMQRTGRSGHAQFRLIVQDSHFSPTRGRVTAYIGSYDPHTKVAILDKDKASQYLTNGAQPSDRVARLLKKEGVKLPAWVELEGDKKRAIRHPEKLRRNRPAGVAAPAKPAEVSPEATAEAAESETPVEAPTPAAETPVEPVAEAEKAAAPEAEEKPAETAAEEAAEPQQPA